MSKARLAAGLLAGLTAGTVGIVSYFEGFEPEAYVDPVGVVTVCYGHTATAKLGQRFSKEHCDALLQKDLLAFDKAVQARVSVPLSQTQKDALVSFAYNVGVGNFERSTLLRKINSGDYCGAAYEFPKWKYAGGRVLPGLVTRRAAEQALFMEGLSCPR
jgi:lysozyme